MRKYGVIYKSVLLENLQYAANVALGFFAYFVFIYIYIRLWGYMYRSPEELIAGYTKEQMIWYVMMTEMLYFGANANVVREVAKDIRGAGRAFTAFSVDHGSGDGAVRGFGDHHQCGVQAVHQLVFLLDRGYDTFPVDLQ